MNWGMIGFYPIMKNMKEFQAKDTTKVVFNGKTI